MEHGKTTGVVANGQTYSANAVVAACHVLTTFKTLLSPEDLPGDLGRRLDALNVGNGFGLSAAKFIGQSLKSRRSRGGP